MASPACPVCGDPVNRRVLSGAKGAEEFEGGWYHYGCLVQLLRDRKGG